MGSELYLSPEKGGSEEKDGARTRLPLGAPSMTLSLEGLPRTGKG
jgi:hypothetical protein